MLSCPTRQPGQTRSSARLNTPAHIVFSLGLLGFRNASLFAVAIAFGAILPDLPMIGFYGYEKLTGVAEHQIWNVDYFLPGWQNLFDLFNSLPIYLLLGVVGWFAGKKAAAMMCFSAVIHCILDFLVHHDDAHRHFYPFTEFRFFSPVSYWDPNHYGNIMSALEVGLFLLVAAVLWVRQVNTAGGYTDMTPLRWVIALALLVYAGFIVFVLTTWMNL